MGHQYLGAERDKLGRVAPEERGVAAAQRQSTCKLPPPCQLSAPSPCTKAAARVCPKGPSSSTISAPRRRIPSRACACVVSGHPTAAPAASPTKTRREIIR